MNFVSSDDFSRSQINEVFAIADRLSHGRGESFIKEHAVMALLFEKPSTRTRVSFEVAMTQLGGNAVYIEKQHLQMSRGETVEDTAKALSTYCDFIAARLYSHSDIVKIAENSVVPVINALTDLEHPTQALADMYTVRAHKSDLRNVRIAFVGDIAANTANSLMLTATKLGSSVSLIGPRGYSPNSIYFNKAREYGTVDVYDSFDDGLEGADFVYTDTFVSMGQEADAERRRALFKDYILTDEALDHATPDTLVMHCLPAHRGEEITADVLDGPKSIVWEQARNKLLIEKSLIIYLSEQTDTGT
ncbi:MAG: ornithine carbamoyltransferase [Candidatus Micrarchaeota archaeon]|nr:ornithine carbamoyltransferase [Candidatus Micrarchaeota archaeon]